MVNHIILIISEGTGTKTDIRCSKSALLTIWQSDIGSSACRPVSRVGEQQIVGVEADCEICPIVAEQTKGIEQRKSAQSYSLADILRTHAGY